MDSALDWLVLPGFSRVGYAVRKRGWANDLERLDGKSVLVTGATSGLGFEAAKGFAELGATVHLLVRNRKRGERAIGQILAADSDADLHLQIADLSSLSSIREFCQRFTSEQDHLHVLVNNAGSMHDEREISVDGFELTFATDLLGPFLLTELLVPLLVRSAPARIINVSSGGMYTERLNVSDLQFEDSKYSGPAAYARAKRGLVVVSELWAEQLRGLGVTVNSMHPGWADTPGVKKSLPKFYKLMGPLLRTGAEGADTIVWLGASPDAADTTGKFFCDRAPRPTHRLPSTREQPVERDQLMAQLRELAGL